MAFIVDAIYESGVFKPLVPIANLKDRDLVRLTLARIPPTAVGSRLVEEQRQRRIQIAPDLARKIGDGLANLDDGFELVSGPIISGSDGESANDHD